MLTTETTARTQLKERSKKRKRNGKKGPMEGTVVLEMTEAIRRNYWLAVWSV